MHSAILVGLLRANIIGLSLNFAMSRIIVSVKAWGTAAAPEMKTGLYHNPTIN